MEMVPLLKEALHETPVAGVRMFARELRQGAGEGGRVFVLVHGLGMSSRYMLPTARLLAAHGRVWVPGFGRSGKPGRVLPVEGLADALGEWMEAHGITQPVVLGNSLGAQVLADFAARYPGRVQAVVLSAPTVDPEARTVTAQFFRLLRDLPREPVGLYGIGFTDYLRAGWATVVETLQEALKHLILETLGGIGDPVLLVSGGRDPIMPERWREEAARCLRHGKAVVLPGVAHAVNFSAPAALVAEVLQFLEALPDAREARPGSFSWRIGECVF